MRKTLSLLLAIVMLMSVLVIPAAAAAPKEEVAEPFDFRICRKCTDPAQYTYLGVVLPENHQTHFTVQVGTANCTRVSWSHNHWANHALKYRVECPYCGVYNYYDFSDCTYHYCVATGTSIV